MSENDEAVDSTSSASTAPHATAGRRAPAGEGILSPTSDETGGPPQTSVFDGAGNESVVVVTENKDGEIVEGTGATLEDALKDADKGDNRLGDAFGTQHSKG